ncbi:hypothetical protein AB4155_01810 [Vibrio splendidus]
MEKSSITNALASVINDKHIIAAVFTSYTFEPNFFELEVIPELLPTHTPYSTDERVKLFQIREILRESGLSIDVFYDAKVFKKEQSPQMEYLCHGVTTGNRAFHAKNIYLLGEDDDGNQTLLFSSGSNNLTHKGWWENIEVQHWEEVSSGNVKQRFLNRLKSDIAFLESNRHRNINSDAITAIKSFLEDCTYFNRAPTVHYFDLERTKGNFFQFLKQSEVLNQYKNWKLEIISPFFPDDPKSKLHQKFYPLGVKSITMLLPQDEEETAFCQKEFFEHINDSDDIEWGQWTEDLQTSLGLNQDVFRKLHAKIFHFYNGMQSWVFIGSVNFSHMATSENVESGFFVRLPKIKSMLEPLQQKAFVKFEPSTIEEGAEGDADSDETLPEFYLTYDWKEKTLIGRTSKCMKYEIQLHGPNGDVVTKPWQVTYNETHCEPSINLEDALKNSSLMEVSGVNERTNKPFTTHRIMIQQTSWTHKPIELPTLTPQQILAIYSGMKPEQRQLVLDNAFINRLVLTKASGEITGIDDDQVENQFFCEYAEIFQAFKILNQRLKVAFANDASEQVDYYLTGAGIDSLPSLIQCVYDKESENYDGIIAYLLSLSALEILNDDDFVCRSNVEGLINEIERRIRALKHSDDIKLDNNSAKDRQRFFDWFETQFSHPYDTESVQ